MCRRSFPEPIGVKKWGIEVEKDRILVLIEQEEGRPAPVTFELLRAGANLSQEGGDVLCACVLGYGVDEIAEEVAYYAHEVYLVDNAVLAHFQSDVYASALEALCRSLDPLTVLIGHTHDNLELAPKLACRMGNEVATDCVKIDREKETGALLYTKPIYGGNAIAVLRMDTRPQIATLRPKVMDALKKGNVEGVIIPFECELAAPLTLTVGLVGGESVSLDKADAIVAGGRGVKTAEGIQKLQGLVEVLNKYFDKVELGASRALVDEGLLPHSRQIGQTGEKVSPQIYIAVAISGAAQHMAGMGSSKRIIAINKDPEASIFESSDYGIVGPYEDIVPALIKKLKELP
jgi:electron transfer flavoprotein alpha subunit